MECAAVLWQGLRSSPPSIPHAHSQLALWEDVWQGGGTPIKAASCNHCRPWLMDRGSTFDGAAPIHMVESRDERHGE